MNETELERRITRAWTMVMRSHERGDLKVKNQWLDVWQKLCVELISQTEVDNKDWPW